MQPIHEKLEILQNSLAEILNLGFHNFSVSGPAVTIYTSRNLESLKESLKEYEHEGVFRAFGLNISVKDFKESPIYAAINKKMVKNKESERFFFVSYNGVEEVPAYTPEGLTFRQKTVIGHLAFSSQGFPSMLFITEQLIPERSKVKVTDVVITLFHEFKSEQDFDDFTVGRNMNDQLDGIIGMN